VRLPPMSFPAWGTHGAALTDPTLEGPNDECCRSTPHSRSEKRTLRPLKRMLPGWGAPDAAVAEAVQEGGTHCAVAL